MSFPGTESPSTSRGMALPTVLAIMVVVFAVVMASASRLFAEMDFSQRKERKVQATYVIQAGLQIALSKLAENECWPGPAGSSFPVNQTVDGDLPDFRTAKYRLEVCNNYLGTSDTTAPDGTPVGIGQVYLKGAALYGTEVVYGEFGQAGNILVKPEVVFKDGFFINEDIFDVFGLQTYIDSYDSDAGPLVPYTGPPGSPAAEPQRYLARVRANQDFEVRNHTIAGEVVHPSNKQMSVGPTGYVKSEVTNDEPHVPLVFARPYRYKGEATVSPVLQPGNVLPPGCYDTLVFRGGTLHFQRGVYYFKSVDVGACKVVVDDGAPGDKYCQIYADRMFRISPDSEVNLEPGTTTAATPVAKSIDFQVYGCDGPESTSTNFHLIGPLKAQMVFAGHRSIVEVDTMTPGPPPIEDVDYYGAIYADNIHFDNYTYLHFDNALLAEQPEAENQWVLLTQGSNH